MQGHNDRGMLLKHSTYLEVSVNLHSIHINPEASQATMRYH
jgi:hypothetical protein